MSRAKQSNSLQSFVPPHDLMAERATLGSIFLRPSVLDEIMEIISVDDFYREANRKIYQAITDLYAKNEPVDTITISSLLKTRSQLEEIGGPVYLMALTDTEPTPSAAKNYARTIHDKAVLRRLLACSQEITGACLEPPENVPEFLDYTEERFFEIIREKKKTEVESLASLSLSDLVRMEEYYYQGKEAHGLPTGFYDYDRLTVGLHPGEVTIIAARPGMGKTALSLNISWNVGHKAKQPVAFFSLEMPKEQLVSRIVSSVGRIDGDSLRRCKLTNEEWAIRSTIQGDFNEAPIFIDDKAGLTALELRAKCRRLKSRHGLSLAVVDYLQLMRSPRLRSRDEEVSHNAYSIKELAKELSIPIIVCCQVNREVEKRPGKKYQLADLRESGAIEQAADNILFQWRDKEGVIADMDLAKQRNGSPGMFQLTYAPAYRRFDNYAGPEKHWQE